MPALSKAQRRLFAIAEHHPSMVQRKNRGVLKMSKSKLHEFASTPEKGLPRKATRRVSGKPASSKRLRKPQTMEQYIASRNRRKGRMFT